MIFFRLFFEEKWFSGGSFKQQSIYSVSSSDKRWPFLGQNIDPVLSFFVNSERECLISILDSVQEDSMKKKKRYQYV